MWALVLRSKAATSATGTARPQGFRGRPTASQTNSSWKPSMQQVLSPSAVALSSRKDTLSIVCLTAQASGLGCCAKEILQHLGCEGGLPGGRSSWGSRPSAMTTTVKDEERTLPGFGATMAAARRAFASGVSTSLGHGDA